MPDKIIASYDPRTGAPIYVDGTRGEPQLSAAELAQIASPAAPAAAVQTETVAEAPTGAKCGCEAAETAEEIAARNAVIAPTPLPDPAAKAADEAVAVNDPAAPTMGEMLDTLKLLMPDLMGDGEMSAASPASDPAVTSSAALTAKAFYDARSDSLSEPAPDAPVSAPASAAQTAAFKVNNSYASAGGSLADAAAGSGYKRSAREYRLVVPEPTGEGDYAPSDCVGFGRRLAAFAIDSVVAWIASLAISSTAGLLLGSAMDDYLLFDITVKAVVRAIVVALYFVLLTGFTGSTLGKRLLRIQVVSPDGAKPSWWSVIYRETVGRYLSSLMCVGYIVLAFDPRHRGFHDMLADTRVVYCR